MNVVIGIDSFKGSLSSLAAGEAVKEAILSVDPRAEVRVCPLADGGEGTARAVTLATGGRMIAANVTGPLGAPVTAEYGLLPDGRTAVIEMATAAGLPLVPTSERNPMNTTTYGVGELIAHAMREHGCRRFLVGIGGSATNDGGIGMLSALGFRFLDREGKPVRGFGCDLANLCAIDTSGAMPELADCEFRIACDVKNPLCGDEGCSRIYGPQKGADEMTVRDMDAWLSHYAELTKAALPHADKNAAGAGAAGGLGFAFLSYLGGALVSGIDLIIEETHLEEKIAAADLVITGEGRLDGQSCMGKAPVGVATCAKKLGKPVIAFAGAVTPDAGAVNAHGIDAFFPILRAPSTLAEAMDVENAYRNLRDTAEQAYRLFVCAKSEREKRTL